jgi:hypothetical protein
MVRLIAFTCRFPKIGVGRAKNQLATVNNIPKWYRYNKTKIKNDLKEELKGWMVPRVEHQYESGVVAFTLYRPNKKRLDADAGCLVYKWIVDLLVEEGYFKDDDKIQLVLNPVVTEPNRVETEIKVEVFAKDG